MGQSCNLYVWYLDDSHIFRLLWKTWFLKCKYRFVFKIYLIYFLANNWHHGAFLIPGPLTSEIVISSSFSYDNAFFSIIWWNLAVHENHWILWRQLWERHGVSYSSSSIFLIHIQINSHASNVESIFELLEIRWVIKGSRRPPLSIFINIFQKNKS